MREHVIEISTEAFHLLQERSSLFVAWSDEKPGPIQRIILEDEIYSDLIDQAIEQRKTIDTLIKEACTSN